MESATLRKWLADRGRSFEPGKDAVQTAGHAQATVRLGNRRAILPDVGAHKRLDHENVRKIVDELDPGWKELPDPASRV